MTPSEVLSTFEKAGALIRDSHIIYTSGRHGSHYVNKDALYPHTDLTSRLCREMAVRLVELKPEVVVAPALGGIILSQWVAHHLSALGHTPVLAVYAEKDGDDFVFRRGYDRLVAGKKAVVLEDILTTGISARRVVDSARAAGGEVLAVSALCNRGGVRPDDIGVTRLDALCELRLESWEEKDCPLCKKKVPVNTAVGKAGKRS